MNREKARLMQIEVCKTAKAMYHSGLVAGTWGNISARIDEDHMVITPSGMDYERLCPEDMVVVDMNTLEYEGSLKPSIETVVHSAVYKDHAGNEGDGGRSCACTEGTRGGADRKSRRDHGGPYPCRGIYRFAGIGENRHGIYQLPEHRRRSGDFTEGY